MKLQLMSYTVRVNANRLSLVTQMHLNLNVILENFAKVGISSIWQTFE
jgi:hypothetical protein